MFLSQTHLNNFVNYMNIKQPNIKYNLEFKINNSFSFLDVKVTLTANQLVTSVFQKATFSGVFTNFKSFIPVAYKFGLVYTLLHPSFAICSSYEKSKIPWKNRVIKGHFHKEWISSILYW